MNVNTNLMEQNVIQINGRCKCKKHHICEKEYV